MRTLEIETLDEFDRLAAGASHMAGWLVQGIDLSERSEVLARLDPSGATFLGCGFAGPTERSLINRGGLIFPSIPDVPFNPYRATLYTPDQLYAGLDSGYEHTPDARIYAWMQSAQKGPVRTVQLREHLAMALHDSAIDDALDEHVTGRRMVGVMGGHAVERGQAAYADAARLGRAIAASGTTVATGGGPGAMEAANLGASIGDGDLDQALATLAAVPSFKPSIAHWAQSARDLGLTPSDRSLGIPTWFYGHEPPNLFSGSIAKYFRNAIREDILLHLCRGGLVFLPGAAGTVQEIFQSACENYYASVPSLVAPMILVGRRFWTEEIPAFDLLRTLGAGREMGERVHLVDDIEEAVHLLQLQ